MKTQKIDQYLANELDKWFYVSQRHDKHEPLYYILWIVCYNYARLESQAYIHDAEKYYKKL